jgi:hypothetical protein
VLMMADEVDLGELPENFYSMLSEFKAERWCSFIFFYYITHRWCAVYMLMYRYLSVCHKNHWSLITSPTLQYMYNDGMYTVLLQFFSHCGFYSCVNVCASGRQYHYAVTVEYTAVTGPSYYACKLCILHVSTATYSTMHTLLCVRVMWWYQVNNLGDELYRFSNTLQWMGSEAV